MKRNLKKKTSILKGIMFVCFSLISIIGYAQEKTISGTVTDRNNEPLIGLSVAIEGTTTGVITDLDGKYSIPAKQGDNLVFSYVGMKTQKFAVTNQTTIDVVMEEDASTMLQETVVIGYGTAKKADLTGSIGNISSDAILKQPALNAAQSIQGKVSGVNIIASDAPGSSPGVIIRGLGTALGGRNPLYIVDGFATDNINNISPSDIVSMNVLKDASSSAIYGLRAANGVIIVTTKRGEEGKGKISVDSYAGIKTVLNKVKMANASQYITYFNESQNMLKIYGDNNTYTLASAAQQPYNTDWYDELLKTGFYNNNTVSISGGGKTVDYFVSYNYYNEKGILDEQSYNRSTIRNNNVYKLFNDKLNIKQNLSVSFSNDHPKDFGAFNEAYRQSPLVPTYYPNGRYGQAFVDTNTGLVWSEEGQESNGQLNSIGNPLLSNNAKYEKAKTYTLQGGLEAEFKLTDFLKVSSRFGATKHYYKNTQFEDKRLRYFNTTGGFNKPDEYFDAQKVLDENKGKTEWANNSLRIEDTDSYRWAWEGFVTFNKNFDGHYFDAVAGLSRERMNIGYTSILQGYDVPYKKQYWSINHASELYEKNVQQVASTARSLASYFARLQYNYNHKYYLSASIRYDGSSTFKSTGDYWGIFPSVGLGWTITEENFMKNVKFLDFLKLRGTWGKLGNQDIPLNVTTITTNPNKSETGNYVFGNPPGYYQGAVFGTTAKDLGWEITREWGVGFDFAMLHNRLSGSIEYYDKTNTNAILEIEPVLSSSQIGTFRDHGAKINNRGVELHLSWADKLPMGLSYEVGFNYSYNKNEVRDVKQSYDGDIGGSLNDGENTKRLSKGQPVYGWWMYQANGVWQSQDEIDQARANGEGILGTPRPGYLKYKDLNNDGAIDDNDKVHAGSYIPSSTYGISLSLGYKNFDFSIDTYGVGGNKIYNGLKHGRIKGGENITEEVFKSRWHGEGTTNKHPGALREAKASTYFLESGSYFRINNITLGYTFRDLVFKGSRLRAYVTAQNPFIVTPYSGFSPELVGGESGAPNRTAGIELFAYPTTRNFLFGVNLEF